MAPATAPLGAGRPDRVAEVVALLADVLVERAARTAPRALAVVVEGRGEPGPTRSSPRVW